MHFFLLYVYQPTKVYRLPYNSHFKDFLGIFFFDDYVLNSEIYVSENFLKSDGLIIISYDAN